MNLIATGNVTGAQVTADVLNVDADGLINLNTTVASTDLWAGTSINLVETDAITLTNVQSGNGSINVDAEGVILAVNVESLTDDDTNDIMLDAVGDLTISGDVNAGAAGDVNLIATGNVTGAQVTADVLNVDADGLINLNTTVASLMASSGSSTTINETDGVTLTDVQSGNGAIGVTAGSASVGDVKVGTVNAGGSVSIVNTRGAINDASDDTVVDITAGNNSITLTARDEIGGMPTAGTSTDTFGKLELPAGSDVDASVHQRGQHCPAWLGSDHLERRGYHRRFHRRHGRGARSPPAMCRRVAVPTTASR